MEETGIVEVKALAEVKQRMLVLLDLVSEYKCEPKQLGTAAKLLHAEKKRIQNSKILLSADNKRDMLWRYDEAMGILSRLKKGKDAHEYARASEDLAKLRDTISGDLVKLKVRLGADKAESAISQVVDRAKETLVKIGEGLKKTITGSDSQ